MDKVSLLECFVDGANGIYVPQKFIEKVDTDEWGIKKEDIEIIEAGPENELYWEAWDEVLRTASKKVDGEEYVIYQDDDLFIQKVKYCDECGSLADEVFEDERRAVCEECIDYESEKPFREVEVKLPKPITDPGWIGEKDYFLWSLFQLEDEKGSYIHVGSREANFWYTFEGDNQELAFNNLKKKIEVSKIYAGATISIVGREDLDVLRLATVKDLFISLDSKLTESDRAVVEHYAKEKFPIKDLQDRTEFKTIDILKNLVHQDRIYLLSDGRSEIGAYIDQKKVDLYIADSSPESICNKWHGRVIIEYKEAIEKLLTEAYIENKNGGE